MRWWAGERRHSHICVMIKRKKSYAICLNTCRLSDVPSIHPPTISILLHEDHLDSAPVNTKNKTIHREQEKKLITTALRPRYSHTLIVIVQVLAELIPCPPGETGRKKTRTFTGGRLSKISIVIFIHARPEISMAKIMNNNAATAAFL